MKALIDADILRYEVGFAAEAGWKATRNDPESLPPFDYVRGTLEQRIANIVEDSGSDSYDLYLTEGETFRHSIAITKPYKGTRVPNKPWHYDNLTVYMRDVLGAKIITKIEADDAMAIEQTASEAMGSSGVYEPTIICSRDKDLRQVPGWVYSWELAGQPSFGPKLVDQVGALTLSDTKPRKLSGYGLAFFYSQMLTGDTADNIPGLPGCGPVAAYNMLHEDLTQPDDLSDPRHMEETVEGCYQNHYGTEWEERMLEQGQLLWMTRRLNEDGSPVLWQRGMYS